MTNQYILRPLKYFLAAGFIAIVFSSNACAQGATATPLNTHGQKLTTIATVNVQNLKLLKQDANALTLSFDISNRVGVQPEVIYAIELLEIDSSGKYSLADQKIYSNDVLNLGANSTIHKEIVYVAPTYLRGTYVVKVEARNSDGLLFGMVQLRNIVDLNGKDESIRIEPGCFLTVEGEKGDITYTLDQGVDIAREETLVLHCVLTNLKDSEQTIIPTLQTRYRSGFGRIIGTEKKNPVILTGGQTATFIVDVPKPTDPQSYDVILTFVNEDKDQLTSPVITHFVLRGESATIQNLTIDKTVYAPGDIAKVTLAWTGSADGFPESRNIPKDAGKDLSALVTILDSQKNPCSETQKETLSFDSVGAEKIYITVTGDCKVPFISAKIVDSTGKVMTENTYKTGLTISKTNVKPIDKTVNNIIEFFIVFIALLCIAALISFLVKRRKSSNIAIFLGLMIGLSVFSFGHEAKADTYRVLVQFDQQVRGRHFVMVDFTANLDKSVYDPEETVTASAAVIYAMCNNGWNQIGVTRAGVDVTINGKTKSILNRSSDFTAQKKGGTYIAAFDTTISVSTAYTENALFEIPYKVNAVASVLPPPVLSFAADDNYIRVGGGTTLRWDVMGDVNSCGASGDWAGSKTPGKDFEAIGPFSSPAKYVYSLQCSGAGGDSIILTQTVNVVNVLPPTLSFSLDEDTIYSGDETTTLRWQAGGKVDSCNASGSWSGSKTPGKDSEIVGPFLVPGSYTYTLECSDPNGISVIESRTLSVTPHISVNGACGIANDSNKFMKPETNLCLTTNNPPVVSMNPLTKRWEWTCTGLYGGESQSCSAGSTRIRYIDF